jgi:hypothetical protein
VTPQRRHSPKASFTLSLDVLADLDALAEEDRAAAKATRANKSETLARLIVAERARRGPAKRVRTPVVAPCDEPLSPAAPNQKPTARAKKGTK